MTAIAKAADKPVDPSTDEEVKYNASSCYHRMFEKGLYHPYIHHVYLVGLYIL
jgi:hypothetical protein